MTGLEQFLLEHDQVVGGLLLLMIFLGRLARL